jgi:hypothetical protein
MATLHTPHLLLLLRLVMAMATKGHEAPDSARGIQGGFVDARGEVASGQHIGHTGCENRDSRCAANGSEGLVESPAENRAAENRKARRLLDAAGHAVRAVRPNMQSAEHEQGGVGHNASGSIIHMRHCHKVWPMMGT